MTPVPAFKSSADTGNREPNNEPMRVFTYVSSNGEPVAENVREGLRIIGVEQGRLQKVRTLINEGKMNLGLHGADLMSSLERRLEPFCIVQATSLPDTYLNDPRTPYPERAVTFYLAPAMVAQRAVVHGQKNTMVHGLT